MATNPGTTSQQQSVGVEDLMPVKSRISWGAIIAGAVVALSVYFVLALLGTALGLTTAAVTTRTTAITERGIGHYATAAVIWATISMLASLFAGGWVAGQLSVGETRLEAMIYGVIVWGTVVAFQMALAAAGATGAASAIMSAANVAGQVAPRADNWESTLRDLGYEQEQIDNFRQKPEEAIKEAREKLKDPDVQRAVLRGATATAWFALAATIAALAAAIGGAVYGSGPEFRLVVRRVHPLSAVRT